MKQQRTPSLVSFVHVRVFYDEVKLLEMVRFFCEIRKCGFVLFIYWSKNVRELSQFLEALLSNCGFEVQSGFTDS